MTRTHVRLATLALLVVAQVGLLGAGTRASDPGLRDDPPGAGSPLPGLTASQLSFFQAGQDDFLEGEDIAAGLGPRFNLDSCGGCHAQPANGGTSPAVNPQVAVATAFGARNIVPFFVTTGGPVREARFKYKPDGTRDGGVHALFVISGRADPSGDASACRIGQENFAAQASAGNLIFRIPTPTFGLGLVEQIPDGAIIANQKANGYRKAALGIAGRPHRIRMTGTTNNNGNDGTIARFGWKAQNK